MQYIRRDVETGKSEGERVRRRRWKIGRWREEEEVKAEREKGRKNWRHHPFTTRSRVADSDRPELGQLTANWWKRKGGV